MMELSLFSKLIRKSFPSTTPNFDRLHLLEFTGRHPIIYLFLGLHLFYSIDPLCCSKHTLP